MYKITKKFSFCYGHRLYKDPGKCGHLHGHTASVEITLIEKDLDNLGMLKNFDEIKEKIGRWIDGNLDHHLILNKRDPLIGLLQKEGEKLFIMEGNPTAENLAKLIYESGEREGIAVKSVAFFESPTSSAVYEK